MRGFAATFWFTVENAVGATENKRAVARDFTGVVENFHQKARLFKDYPTALQPRLLSTASTALQPSLEMSDVGFGCRPDWRQLRQVQLCNLAFNFSYIPHPDCHNGLTQSHMFKERLKCEPIDLGRLVVDLQERHMQYWASYLICIH